MLRMKVIDPNNSKYTEILTKNTLISGNHVKLLPGANNLGAKLLFNIFKNHYFCTQLDIFYTIHEKYRF